MTMYDNTDPDQPPTLTHKRRVWFDPDTDDLSGFDAAAAQTARPGDWPHAQAVERNILIYDGTMLDTLDGGDARRALAAEWAQALADGPGVIVIRGAIADRGTIDQATRMFEGIISCEAKAGAGGGDHFAKAGANARIWNALQKHCLADPANFARYFGVPTMDLVAEAWLGPAWQMTAQVNLVYPGGAAQTPHRDYHLGFMPPERAAQWPVHAHQLTPFLTLQGAIAHCDMPLESGPTVFLPFSQRFAAGYVAFARPQFQEIFRQRAVQLPLAAGDAVFFNPALMHGAGHNRSPSTRRMANLLQVSSAFGRAMEAVDRAAMCRAIYPELRQLIKAGAHACAERALRACAEGYPFPTNLDLDPPHGGLAPPSQADIMTQALVEGWSEATLDKALADQARRSHA